MSTVLRNGESTALVTVWLLCAASRLVAESIAWNGNWAKGCDFRGNDLKNEHIPGDQCGGRCWSIQECTHFSWTLHNGGTCWLKRGSVSKSDAIATGDDSTVCGLIREAPSAVPGNKVAGTTTRYWDCCKPGCSWLGKAPGNKFVQACYNDGNERTQDVNTRSSCDGGQAYTCNNNQPWAVNEQLAYGFAAVGKPGPDERGLCCACYQLDFTSDPLKGKSMVVQVSDSGEDLRPNQFDLHIPGGGVGIFNGCTAQWNAGPNGWGQRYGGVSSRAECDALPSQIRNGCYWRFDWFRGADNPTIAYSRVRCPDELVAISGCRRDED